MNERIVILFSAIISAAFVTANDSSLSFESCSEVKVIKKGCYRDPGSTVGNRTLPGHQPIYSTPDWGDGWDNYIESLACYCANQAKAEGSRFFGLQNYWECWTGSLTSEFFSLPETAKKKKCWGIKPNYDQCETSAETACVGTPHFNYIYEIVEDSEGPEEIETDICKQQLLCQNGECISNGDSYTCLCNPDYTGVDCNVPIDNCVGNPCGNGICIDGVNSYKCHCNDGYEGQHCEKNIDDCAENPCLNGKCIDGVNSYDCQCNDGYQGQNCEKNIDDCAENPCLNGKCKDGVNAYECQCNVGYQGERCENNVDDCVDNPCGKNGKCIDGINSYECQCKPGYKGGKCETNINECIGNKCRYGKCIDGINTYECQCNFGYEGNMCEQEVTKPGSCSNANWWKSFDKKGWSKCGKDNSYITGFYRSSPEDKDPIYLLEEAKCCDAMPLLSKRPGECVEANWGNSMETNNKWSLCPKGYFLNGMYRKQWLSDNLNKIDHGRCCRPKEHPGWYGKCFDDTNVGKTFDKKGWSSCSKTGYYITGVYRGSGEWLHHIERFRCCQMVASVVDADWVLSFDKKGWSTCGKTNMFITGFYRSKSGEGWFTSDGINRLERARCKKSAIVKYQGDDSTCINKNWWKTLDNERSWAKCPAGYFLNGLYRTDVKHEVHNIEEGKCCKPKTHPAKYGSCYNENIKSSFQKKGWSVCKKTGYYVAGIYRHDGDQLYHIQKLYCCKMSG